MKHLIGLALALSPWIATAQTILFQDDFEFYADGVPLAAQSSQWTTFSNAPGGPEDGIVSAAQAHGGARSLHIFGSGGDGPVDQIALFGDLTYGELEFELWIYVAPGAGGYFDLMHVPPFFPELAAAFTFRNDGSGEIELFGTGHPFSYAQGTWTEVKATITFAPSLGTYFINGTQVASENWSTNAGGGPGQNALRALEIYAYSGTAGVNADFYVDDVRLTQLAVGVEEASMSQINIAPNPVSNGLWVQLPEAMSQAELTVFDVLGDLVLQHVKITGSAWIDMDQFPSGVYAVRMSAGNRSITRQVLKN